MNLAACPPWSRFAKSLAVTWVLGISLGASSVGWAETLRENPAELLNRLRATTNATELANLCARLRAVAGPEAVPVLTPLLQDPLTAHAALHALEVVPGHEVTAALHAALAQATGAVRLAIVQTLGLRGDPASAAHLAPLLDPSDPGLLAATSLALARIGSAEAEAALERVWIRLGPQGARLIAPAVLLLADMRRSAGQTSEALAWFERLMSSDQPAAIRRAAWIGKLRSAGPRLLEEAAQALTGSDPEAVPAVLALWPEWPVEARTALAIHALSRAGPLTQAAVLAHLEYGAGPETAPVVRQLIHEGEPPVRVAAIRALAVVGDASDTELLLQRAAHGVGAEQEAARWALAHMAHPGVTPALIEQLRRASGSVQLELVRVLSARHDTAAVPPLIHVVRTGPASARSAALRALIELAGPAEFAPLVRWIAEVSQAEVRREGLEFFQRWLERLDPRSLDPSPLLEAMTTTAGDTAVALHQIAGWLRHESVRTAMRRALTAADPARRSLALETLTQTRDPALLPDLVRECEKTQNPKQRARLFEAAIRLLSEHAATAPESEESRVTALRLLAVAHTPALRRLGLSVLPRFPHPDTLRAVEQLRRDDPTVRAEAESASCQLASALADSWSPAEDILASLAAEGTTPAIRAQAADRLRQLHSGWQVAGPYRVQGREGPALFDVPFPPEETGTQQIAWRTKPPASPDQPGHVDLTDLQPGDHCVLYARTGVYAPVDLPVLLRIGSDDGIKLWINRRLVHAHNAIRGLVRGQDHAPAHLQRGWNTLLVKLTQHTAGCGFWIEILRPDGSPIPDLVWDPRGRESQGP